MKVLYITYDGLSDPLGQSQVLPYLEKLSSMGVKYTVLSFEKKSQLPKEMYDKFNIIALKYHKKPPVISTLYDIIHGTIRAFKAIKKDQIDIVHARGYVSAVIALFLKKMLKVKFVFDMRGFFADERAEAGLWKKGGFLYKAAKRLEKSFFLLADHIVSLTENGERAIQAFEYMEGRKACITVIPTCVDLDKFKPKSVAAKTSAHYLIYAGSISTWYMPQEMIDFVNVARKNLNNCQFLLLTQEDDYTNVLLKKRGIDFAKVLSADHDDVPGHMSLADAGVAFYKPGFSRKACSPTKLGEYLACGIPVIINSGIGDSDDMVESEGVGVVVKSFCEDEYVKAVKKLTNMLSEGEKLTARCRNTAQKYFSLKNGSNKFYNIYEEVLRS